MQILSRVVRPQSILSTTTEHVVRQHLERVLQSPKFDASSRSRDFLCFVVNEALAGRGPDLNQTAIAVGVFGRRGDFDAVLDPIVRVQAGRLRRSLERYYLITDDTASVRIELPKGSYAPLFVTAAESGEADSGTQRSTQLESAADWPIVVVHPFTASFDADAETAARLHDELAMELCRYGDVRVVRKHDMEGLDPQRQAAVRFELRGSLRRDGDDALVGARLVDRMTGEQVWSDEYHSGAQPGRGCGSIDDIARVIAARTGAEHGVIVRILAGEYGTLGTEPADRYGAILRCHRFLLSRRPGELTLAIEALHRLTTHEPEIVVGWVCLARLYLINHSFELCGLHTPLDKAIGYASQGVALDPAGARSRCLLAAALLMKGELPAARAMLEQTLRSNPDSLAYREVVGWLLALCGDWQRGMAVLHDAMNRNPYCLPQARHGLWADRLRRGEFEAAYSAALEYQDSSSFWRELMTACCLGHLGRQDEARAAVAELLQSKPDFVQRGRTLIGYYIKSAELFERVVDGLRKAGLALA